jgi:hypothetical protein
MGKATAKGFRALKGRYMKFAAANFITECRKKLCIVLPLNGK